MNQSFSLLEVVVLIGITEGLVISFLIWFYKKQIISKLILSFILIVFSLLCAKILVHTTGLWNMPHFRYIPLAFELLIQPLFWLYISSLVTVKFRLSKKIYLHFVPFFVFFLYALLIYFATLQTENLAEKDLIANNLYFNPIKKIEDFLSIISSIVYWFLGLKIIQQYKQWLHQYTSNTNYPTYEWLKNIAWYIGLLIVMLSGAIFLDSFLDYPVFTYWQLFFVYLALIIYYLGFKGYALPNDTFGLEQLSQQEASELYETQAIIPAEISPPLKPNPHNEQVKAEIIKAIEEKKMYLDPELSLNKLAKELNMSVGVLSAIINQSFQKGFRELINEYRVAEVKRRLQDPLSKKLSMVGIAYECGFNSEASFYRIFKSMVGVSPKTYWEQQQLP